MPRKNPSPDSRQRRHNQTIRIDIVAMHRLIYAWLALGTIAVIFVPALRGYDAWIGWLPFWLIGAPLINLLALHPHRLAALSQRLLVGLRQRRQAVSRRNQAKNLFKVF
ncbi:hypothetical protein ELE36_18780 [Pseudolysobacter antarcticus]|uniref:Uncharacterized protein n=1 Tax=Pseudolysobacter antarcticus TaxID=2511995 RepID=A0A411HP16_9GAMM|nr:hypothetical protein [Pseudolysobacter antarcticus]QBB72248.1 hypothetical protein ELE36_18780 [Pseudolysobacter antarcticus]